MARSRERRLATARDRVAAAAGDFPDTNPKRERGSLSTAGRVLAPNPKASEGLSPPPAVSSTEGERGSRLPGGASGGADRNPRWRFGLV